jgi:iron complex outermembrane receptor protein
LHATDPRLIVLLLTLATPAAARADNPAEVMEMGRIDVVATTPLPGLGTPIDRVPANVQVFTARDLLRQRPVTLPDFLQSGAAGVHLNASQGNPFQPDVSYRGFTASPLLGFPQGLSVFQDGVRINEPFGDGVNWDLLPQSAIASIQLLPGANAVFGPNTLGGAIAVHTKSGSQYPGGTLEAYGGTSRRRALEWEQGGSGGAWDYFATANVLRDAGWAAHNPSRIGQVFAKVGHQTDTSDLDLSFTGADNALSGTQTLPLSFFDDIRQPYTHPDRIANRLAFTTAKGSRFLSPGVLLGATAYARRYRSEAFASNVNDGYGAIEADGGIDTLEATNDRSHIDQSSHGLGVQLTIDGHLGDRDNRFVGGASGDFGNTRFTHVAQDARFDASRGTVATGDFATVTDAASRSRQYGVFFTDTLSWTEHWVLTLSGRHNVTLVSIADRSGAEPRLDGEHRFARFSPAAGVNFNPTPRLTTYVSYTRSMRAPTPIELTCADPDAPCRLPNSFIADPPLAPVRAATAEAGARGRIGAGGTWSAALYRTATSDDIQFVASGAGATNQGYFRNVGVTVRRGTEVAVGARWGGLSADARFSYVDATFQTAFLESSPANSSADASGAIAVSPGDRIPGIPRHTLNLRLAYEGASWSAGTTVAARGSSHARGDENNRDVNGRVPGYAVASLDGRWRPWPDTEIFARVDNAFDRRYASVGVLGRNFFGGPGNTFDGENSRAEQFRGPGAPRAAYVGVRVAWR